MSDANEPETPKLDETPATPNPPPEAKKQQRSSIAFPYMDLDEAITLATSVHKEVSTGPCSAEQLAAWIGQSPSSSAFRLRLSASRLFGVLDTERSDAIRLTDLGRMVVDTKREREARARSFLNVPLYRAVFDKFKGGVIPPTAALERELVSLGVASTLKDRARAVLERSAEQAGYFDHGRDRLVMPGYTPSNESDDHALTPEHKEPTHGGGGPGGEGGTGLNLDPLLMALLSKVPSKDKGWPPANRLRWFRTFAMNVSQVFDDDDNPVELAISIAKEPS